MKQKTHRLLSLLLCMGMVLGLLPATPAMASEPLFAGTTGTGTESDPVIVDTYAEMKAALEYDADLYIKVVGFDHTTTSGGRTYRELVAGTDYTPGMNQGAITIPSGKIKHLTIATDIICYAEATVEADSMWTFIHNLGTLYIDGTGKLAVNFNATYIENVINAIVLNRGSLYVNGSVTFDATQDRAIPARGYAIVNGNGNSAKTQIYGGTFIASNNSNGLLYYGNSVAVAAEKDGGYMWIYGGEFKATPSGSGTGYGAGGDYGNLVLIGGTFEGVSMSPNETNQGKYLSDILGDGAVYRRETGAAFDGSTIKTTTEKVHVVKPETIITGPVEVSVTAPVAGNTPAMTATTTTANVQQNPACCWYPLDENGNLIISGMLGKDDTFEAGKNYAVGVVLLPEDGYEFADTTVVNINGGVAEKSLPTSFESIQATYYFASEIKAVNMTVSTPEIGKTPNEMTYTATGLASGTNWFYANANATGSIMSGTGAFVSGNTYSAIYQFKIPASSNAVFATTITTSDITVNNGTVYAVNRISDKEIQVTVNFPTLHETIIDEVNMTVSAPEIGKTPNEMTYDATGLISGANWFYASANATGSIMSGDTAFVSGNTYSAIYQFTIPEGSAAKFAAEIGTGDITVSSGTVYSVYRAGDKEIQVTVNFPTLSDENIIDTVEMTVSAPEVGKTPNDMTYSATGLTPGANWFYASANATGSNMSGTDVFASGNTYSAIYQFTLSESSPSKFASTITTSNITVNNGTVYAVNHISDKKIEVTVNFPTLADENIIDTVVMTVSAPQVGKTPNEMTHSATGLTPGAYWFYASANATGSNMSGTDVFASGNTYSAIYQFTLSESSPSKFASTITTSNITVNNGTVYAVNHISDKKIEVTVNFGELSSTTVINTIAATITPPVAGATPDLNLVLPTGVQISTGGTNRWYDMSDGTGTGTLMAPTDTYIAGRTYLCRFTVEAKPGYIFTNPISAVTLNGNATTIFFNDTNILIFDATFVATAASATEYDITVTDGKATIGAGTEISKAAEGTTVTLTADAAPAGKVFNKWEVVSGSVTLANANSATTTFTMPAGAVSVKATYKNEPVTTYTLATHVNGGHGTISAGKIGLTAGSTETVIFTPDAGYEIDTVTVNGVETGVLSNVLNVTMDADKTVIVTYKATGSDGHTHSYGSEWKSDADKHWHECSCGDTSEEAPHTFKWVVDKEATATEKGSKHEECEVCGYKKAAVEIPATGTTKPTDPSNPTDPGQKPDSPETGDNSNLFLWAALLFVSGCGIFGATIYSKKKKEFAE